MFPSFLIQPLFQAILLGTLPKVGQVGLWDLWLHSEVVVLGRVETIQRIRHDTPSGYAGIRSDRWRYEPALPIATVEVLRSFKGPGDRKRILYLACGTWTCDITRAEVGETALFFFGPSSLPKSETKSFWDELERVFGSREVLAVGHSGRGRMPLRQVDDRDFVTYWSEDVRLPKNLASIDGPEPGSDWIRSVPLEEITSVLGSYSCLRDRLILSAATISRGPNERAWDFWMADEGTCRLLVHDRIRGNQTFPDPRREEEIVLHLDPERVDEVRGHMKALLATKPPVEIGSAVPGGEQRELRLVLRPGAEDAIRTPIGESSVRIYKIDTGWLADPGNKSSTIQALRLWRSIRDAFNAPDCADHRPADDR